MKVLLVEDQEDYVDSIRTLIEGSPVTIHHVLSRDSALDSITRGGYDLVVCDLNIPSVDGGFDHSTEHGEMIRARLLSEVPGTPIIVHSGKGDVEYISSLFADAERTDLFGGEEHPLLAYVPKSDTSGLIQRLRDLSERLNRLREIEVDGGSGLDPLELRALLVYASRLAGRMVHIQLFPGGLSDAHVARVTIERDDGQIAADVVVKLSDLRSSRAEIARHQRYVAPVVQQGGFPALFDSVTAGTGTVGAVFYSVADRFDRNLFQLLQEEPTAGVPVVRRIREITQRWNATAPRVTQSVGDIRRRLMSDEKFASVIPVSGLDVSDFESRATPVRECTQHLDLHGENVLIDRELDVVLIDFAMTGPAISGLDPVVLELSTVFHPGGLGEENGWPTPEQAENWADLERFIVGCPFADFIVACREWAHDVAPGKRALLSCAYAYGARQLGYPDTPKALAQAIMRGAAHHWDM